LLLNLPFKITTELTFEDVYLSRGCTFTSQCPKILQSRLATEFAMRNHYRADFREFFLSPENPEKVFALVNLPYKITLGLTLEDFQLVAVLHVQKKERKNCN